MPNTQQNNIQKKIKQIKKEIDLLQDRLEKKKYIESISKWVNAH